MLHRSLRLRATPPPPTPFHPLPLTQLFSMRCDYVITHDGNSVYKVPTTYIVRDQSVVVNISYLQWLYLAKDHARFGAGIFNGKRITDTSSIVVVSTGDFQMPEQRKNYWFLRCSVNLYQRFGDLDCSRREQHTSYLQSDCQLECFGDSFLWQMPYTSAVSIQAELESRGVTPYTNSLLQYTPCSSMFEPKQLGLKEVHSLPLWNDRVFFMSVRPSRFAYPYCNENRPVSSVSMARKINNSVFDMSSMPCDVYQHILTFVVRHSLESYTRTDFDALLNLRLVCSTFNETVCNETKLWVDTTLQECKEVFNKNDVSVMINLRDRTLNAGISMLSIVRDAEDPSWMSYIRWKLGKRVGSLPPADSRPTKAQKTNTDEFTTSKRTQYHLTRYDICPFASPVPVVNCVS